MSGAARNLVLAIAFSAVLLATNVLATHPVCTPGAADRSTYTILDTDDGRRFYVEVRRYEDPFAPGAGERQDVWVHEETNGIDDPDDGSLQRGDWTCFPRGGIACNEILDPAFDVHCGHGPDTLVYGGSRTGVIHF
ncbi:MAG TPA: hypothetical protein VI997_03720 [Candidatus Thermoplasmatota archaeon]|nr:hypothetical protein [Candidatus Thermoplasmatota archaeon]